MRHFISYFRALSKIGFCSRGAQISRGSTTEAVRRVLWRGTSQCFVASVRSRNACIGIACGEIDRARIRLTDRTSLRYLAIDAPVAQLDRAPPSEGGGRTFESCRVRHLTPGRDRRSCNAIQYACASDRPPTKRRPSVDETDNYVSAGALSYSSPRSANAAASIRDAPKLLRLIVP